MGLYCANDSKAQYLGVFLAKISGTPEDDGQERTVHTLVYVLKGSNCLMSKSILMKLGCLPKAFPEIGRFNEDDGMMSMNQLAAGPPVTGSCCDYDPIPVSPMSQSIPLRVPVMGKSEGRQGTPTPTVRQAVDDCDPESTLLMSTETVQGTSRVSTHACNSK